MSKGWGEQSKLVHSIDDLIVEGIKSQSKLLVVDETYMSLDKFDKSQAWITKTSRHGGHSALLVGHNITDISTSIRNQCTQIFVLGCARSDARILADLYDDDDILKCTKLEKFCFGRIFKNKVSFGKVDPNTFETIAIDIDSVKDEEPETPPVKVPGKNVRKRVDKLSDKG